MNGINDFIIKTRVNYIEKQKKIIKKLTPNNVEKAFAKYMLCENNYSFKGFLNGLKKTKFHKKLVKELGPFSLEKLMKTELFKEDKIYNDGFMSIFDRAISSIDGFYAPFLEPLRTLPFYFTEAINEQLDENEKIKADINCVGKAFEVIALYSEHNDVNDLEIHRIYSTRRLDKVISALKRLQEGDFIIIDEKSPYLAEKSKEFLDSQKLRDVFSKIKKSYFYDFVYVDVDVFHGEYAREQIEDMLLEHALSLDYFTHVHIKNKKTGETYDYEGEVYGKNKYYKDKVEEGLLKTSLTNFALFFSYINPQQSDQLYEFFKEHYKDKEDIYYLSTISKIIINTNYLNLDLINKFRENIEKIIKIFGKEKTPINWLLVASKVGILKEKEVREIIIERFGSELAYEKARQRFGF